MSFAVHFNLRYFGPEKSRTCLHFSFCFFPRSFVRSAEVRPRRTSHSSTVLHALHRKIVQKSGPSCSEGPPTQSVPLTKRCRGPPFRIRKNSKNGAEKRVFFRRRYCRPGAPSARLRRACGAPPARRSLILATGRALLCPDPCVLTTCAK